MDLELQKVRSDEKGAYITHSRAKQRTDKKSTVFLVPRTKGQVNFAAVLEQYVDTIKTDLGKFTGRFFWTGKQLSFVNTPLGKNMVSTVPKEMAEYLKKENVSEYTFHSLRRSSATFAADKGATAQQMTDFYGWKSVNMAQEYISTSKNAVNNMATLLKSPEFAGELEPAEDDLGLQESSLLPEQSTACNSEPARKSIIIHNLTFNNGNLNF